MFNIDPRLRRVVPEYSDGRINTENKHLSGSDDHRNYVNEIILKGFGDFFLAPLGIEPPTYGLS